MSLIRCLSPVIAWALFLCSCVPAISSDPDLGMAAVRARLASAPRPAVLFIGNSYTFGLPAAFGRAAKTCGREVEVAQATRNGQSLAGHAADPATLKILRSRPWDVVVLQEASLTPANPIMRRFSMVPAVKKLAKEARRQGAQPVLYQTWGRRAGNPKLPDDDFYQMNHRIREGYGLASRKAGNLPIVPVGEAWEQEYRADRGAELYQPDGSHPSARGGRLIAETFCKTLLGESERQ